MFQLITTIKCRKFSEWLFISQNICTQAHVCSNHELMQNVFIHCVGLSVLRLLMFSCLSSTTLLNLKLCVGFGLTLSQFWMCFYQTKVWRSGYGADIHCSKCFHWIGCNLKDSIFLRNSNIWRMFLHAKVAKALNLLGSARKPKPARLIYSHLTVYKSLAASKCYSRVF